MPPKKRRLNNGSARSSSAATPITPDLNTWPGWCEIESEPAFFNTILHDMGVRGLRIQEVFGIDDTALAILPQPVHAVIFLFRYQKDELQEEQEKECPSHIWFANQVPENACGTVSLLNIVNNIPNLKLGQQLESFKSLTESFDPVARGHAIDDFDFVRKIHNSFARKTDMLIVDTDMKERHERAVAKRKTEAAIASRAAKAAERAVQRTATNVKGPSLRINPPRTTRTAKPAAEEQLPEESEAAFHFIAYMPIRDHVWKLDGMDKFPTNLGKIAQGRDWLKVVQTALSDRMAQYEEGQMQFSLMAVVRDPIIEARRDLAQNIRSLQETQARLVQISPDWRNFTNPENEGEVILGANEEHGITAKDIVAASIPDKLYPNLGDDGGPESLVKLRSKLITAQAGCRATVRDCQQAARSDAEESMHRRHDYDSFIQAWLQALANNGTLSELLETEQEKQ